MTPDDSTRFVRIDAAVRAGDLTELRRAAGDPPGFPDVDPHLATGPLLTYAIYHAPIALVAELLAAGADPNRPADDGFPPLVAAAGLTDGGPEAQARAHAIVTLLLDHGADTDQRGVNDDSALHLAAANGDLALVDLLLGYGADPESTTHIDNYETPLEVAMAAGHTAVVARLEPLTPRLRWEESARACDLRALRRMLREGQDVDATDGFGQTALMRAAHAGQADVVRLLVSHDADLDRVAKYGLSALMLAVTGGHPRIARALAAAGADLTLQGSGAPGFAGRTASDLAAERGDARLGRALVPRPPASPPPG